MKPKLALMPLQPQPHICVPQPFSRTQTNFNARRSMKPVSKLNHQGQRLTATPLREVMHSDLARHWPADPPPACTHQHTFFHQPWALRVRSHKFTRGLFQAASTINYDSRHVQSRLQRACV